MIEGSQARRAARGMKRTCQDCDGRFYDLTRVPVVCPLCGVAQPELAPMARFDPSVPPPRGVKWRDPVRAKPVPVAAVEADVEDATDEVVADAVEDDADETGAADTIVDEAFLEDTVDDAAVPPVATADDDPRDV